MTKNGEGRRRLFSPIVTCHSSIASRSADWTFGGVRLISSARRIWVNIGHFLTSNFPSWGRNISLPERSEGRRSGVNDIRLNSYPSTFASVFTVFVFPSHGTHSMRTCPHAKRLVMSLRMRSLCPIMTLFIEDSRASMISRVEERFGFITLRIHEERKIQENSINFLDFCKKENVVVQLSW